MTRLLLAAVFVFLWSTGAPAGTVHVGVAANFVPTLNALGQAFERESGHRLKVSRGSTGKLYAQISNGAPYDVLLAADSDRPQRLEAEGMIVPGSRFVYALGELALWSPDPKRVDGQGAVLRDGEFRHLALANPKTAPYGVAAREALQQLGLWEKLQPRLVFGEDIWQAFQFVQTGNAELGLVALSQVQAAGGRGSMWRVPSRMHAPIRQEAVMLRRARNNDAAHAFLAFLKSDAARRLIASDGYGVP